MPFGTWQVKPEFSVRDLVGIMGRCGFAEGKAAEGRRTPRRWRVDRALPNGAKRLGRAGDGKKARGAAKLFHLFDDEHFDGHIGGNKFEAIMRQKQLVY